MKEKLNFWEKAYYGFFMSWGCFCTIPCPKKIWHEEARNTMLSMLKYIGLIIGALEVGLFYGMEHLNVPTFLKAGILAAYPFLITGFIHLDGFMDCCDAILSRRSLEERQRILKDSNVGAFAVISLVLMVIIYFASMISIVLKADALTNIIALAFVYPLTRMFSANALMKSKTLKTSQYNISSNEEGISKIKIINLIGGLVVLGIAILVLENLTCCSRNFTVFPITIIVYSLACDIASKSLGGISGDIVGYSLVWAELAAVMVLAI